jgi:hypothetical protein
MRVLLIVAEAVLVVVVGWVVIAIFAGITDSFADRHDNE